MGTSLSDCAVCLVPGHRPEGKEELAHLLSFCGNSAKNHITSNSGKPCSKDTAQICKALDIGSPFQIFLSG